MNILKITYNNFAMDFYIQEWVEVIEGGKNTNTYKPAFAKALLECISANRYFFINPDTAMVDFLDIAECMIRYYWNQLFFFKLRQQPGDKVPVVYQCVNALIEKYKELRQTSIACWADEGLKYIKDKAGTSFYETFLKKAALTLNKDVAYRLPIVNGIEYPIYSFNKKDSSKLYLKREEIDKLKEFSSILIPLINYRWSLLLEKYNNSPNILLKVKNTSNNSIHRNDLSEFKNFLVKNEFLNQKPIDFYSGILIPEKEISVDHVIPWSFLYRDDIWNLVLTTRSNNSIKSNNKPNEAIIYNLEKRNKILYGKLPDGKYKASLKEAIDCGLVRSYYYQMMS